VSLLYPLTIYQHFREFLIETANEIYRIVALTRHFVLIFCENEDGDKDFCQIAEFDWSTNNVQIGPCIENHNSAHEVFVDRQSTSNTIDFLFCNLTAEPMNCWHYRVHTNERRLEQLPDVIHLQNHEFTCMELCGGIIRSVNIDVDKINQFDLTQRRQMKPVELSGLPSEQISRKDASRYFVGIWRVSRGLSRNWELKCK
jgi:hypothetical protein